MHTNWQERTALLIKKEGLEKLGQASILVVGLGGVGACAAEFLVRAGIQKLSLVDGDTVAASNINRQLPALRSTVGKYKVDVVGDRLLDINPELELLKINEFLSPERMPEVLQERKYDYVLDCIDSVSPKLSLIIAAKRNKIKLVSAMGAGGKTDPSKVMVRDISKTNNCFLARHIRKQLKKEEIHKGFRCVFSTEIQEKESLELTDGTDFKKSFYGTISYMPALFGLYAAAEVINYLRREKTR